MREYNKGEMERFSARVERAAMEFLSAVGFPRGSKMRIVWEDAMTEGDLVMMRVRVWMDGAEERWGQDLARPRKLLTGLRV